MLLHLTQLKLYAAQFLAELFSTCLLILIGNLGVAQNKFTPPENQNIFGINLSYGTGVYVALMVAAPISGAHINPAVTVGLLSLQKLTVIQSLFYIAGQVLGAFLACPLVYLVYLSQFNLYDGGIRQIQGPNGTADVFYTVPTAGVPNWNCFLDALIGTSVLMIFILAMGNEFNQVTSNAAKPFAYVVLITTFGFCLSANSGNPINPARDFGPRLFAACIYGWEVFRVNDYYFWITIIGPLVGSLIGVWLFEGYFYLTKNFSNLPAKTEEKRPKPLESDKPFRFDTQITSESSVPL